MSELEGQTVVIVGGSSGMGLGAAQVAAKAGASVIIASHSQEKMDAAISKIDGIKGIQVDILNEQSIQQLFEQVGQLNHLFVTAAPGSRGEFLKQSINDARKYMDGKFWGSYTCAYYAAAKISQGSITFLSGGLSRRPEIGSSMVTASQAAVEGLAKALAVELAPIRVNTIMPGAIDTEMWDFLSEEEREKFRQQAAEVPAGRIGQAEDIGKAAVFLMTNSFITGTLIEVNGGQFLI